MKSRLHLFAVSTIGLNLEGQRLGWPFLDSLQRDLGHTDALSHAMADFWDRPEVQRGFCRVVQCYLEQLKPVPLVDGLSEAYQIGQRYAERYGDAIGKGRTHQQALERALDDLVCNSPVDGHAVGNPRTKRSLAVVAMLRTLAKRLLMVLYLHGLISSQTVAFGFAAFNLRGA